MPPVDQTTIRNRLLSLMPRNDFERLTGNLILTPFEKGLVLSEPGQPIEHAYFPESGMG